MCTTKIIGKLANSTKIEYLPQNKALGKSLILSMQRVATT